MCVAMTKLLVLVETTKECDCLGCQLFSFICLFCEFLNLHFWEMIYWDEGQIKYISSSFCSLSFKILAMIFFLSIKLFFSLANE